MKLSASQAAKQAGKSIPTITRAIKKGRLSATPLEGGGYEIDPAELFRVFPALTSETLSKPNMLGDETPNVTHALEAELEAIKEQLRRADEMHERERELLNRQIEDLRVDRDAWRKQASTLLLEDQRVRAETVKAEAKPQGFFKRLFG